VAEVGEEGLIVLNFDFRVRGKQDRAEENIE